jgi:hypothetical protein
LCLCNTHSAFKLLLTVLCNYEHVGEGSEHEMMNLTHDDRCAPTNKTYPQEVLLLTKLCKLIVRVLEIHSSVDPNKNVSMVETSFSK